MTACEKHYTVEEIAEMWNLSRDSIRRLFQTEDGVLRITRPGSRYKRAYTTLRVPESVLNRVYERMSRNVLAGLRKYNMKVL